MAREQITILHLSDLRFCKGHRFGEPIDKAEADDWEGLVDRMDLERVGAFDLITIAGNLTEHGRASEFRMVRAFLDAIMERLGLGPQRVLVVPGPRDVNLALCEGYFASCAGHEIEPRPPYWPKWGPYEQFFCGLYQAVPTYTFLPDQPWSLFRIADLGLRVAGLNATLAVSHLAPDGVREFGQAQLQAGAGFLTARSTVRVVLSATDLAEARASLVDPPTRRPPDPSGPSDAADGCSYHGVAWLSAETPPRDAGSWASVVRLQSHGIYSIDLSGDQRTPAGSDRLRWSYHVGEIHGLGSMYAPYRRRWHTRSDASGEPAISPLLGWVLEAAERREVGSSVTMVADASFPYVRVTRVRGGGYEHVPVGVFEHGIERVSLDAFDRAVLQPYRDADPNLRACAVARRLPVDLSILEHARRLRVELHSLTTWRQLIDFEPFVHAQTKRLQTDRLYPSKIYVTQRMRDGLSADEPEVPDALAAVESWLGDAHSRFMLVLGSFGTGKTFLLHELARRMGERWSPGDPIPLFIELRHLEKSHEVSDLVLQQYFRVVGDGFSADAFDFMLEKGRLVFFFDGFDELVLRLTYERAAHHLSTLMQAARGHAKVVVTCRTEHFLTERDIEQATANTLGEAPLLERLKSQRGLRFARLMPFREPEIRRFLVNQLGEDAARDRFDLIRGVKDLLGLSANPRMLSQIAQMPADRLRAAAARTGEATAADLYEQLIQWWLENEVARKEPTRGAVAALGSSACRAAVVRLALRLWRQTEPTVGLEELESEVKSVLRQLAEQRRGTSPQADEAAHQVGSGTLLVRDEHARFRFVHLSVQEYLVARHIADAFADGEPMPVALDHDVCSGLMLQFLEDLVSADALTGWVTRILWDLPKAGVCGPALENALSLLDREVVDVERPLELAGQDLRGRPGLRDLDLRNADLRGANLAGVDLSGMDLSGANLAGADFSRARLVQARLHGGVLTDADFTRAAMLGVGLSDEQVESIRGVAIAVDLSRATPEYGHRGDEVATVALDSARGLLYAAHWSGALVVWDVETGRVVGVGMGVARPIGMLVSDDGRWLFVVGRHSQACVMDAVALTVVSAFDLPRGCERVSAMAIGPNGGAVALALDDAQVAVWQLGDACRRSLHTVDIETITSIAFDSTEDHLVAASDTGRLKTLRLNNGWYADEHLMGMRGLVLSSDARFVAGHMSEVAIVIERETRATIGEWPALVEARFDALARDGSVALLVRGSRESVVCDAGSGALALSLASDYNLSTIPGRQHALGDGPTLACAMGDGGLAYARPDGVAFLDAGRRGIAQIALSPDLTEVAWSTTAGAIVRCRLRGERRPAVDFSGFRNGGVVVFSAPGVLYASDANAGIRCDVAQDLERSPTLRRGAVDPHRRPHRMAVDRERLRLVLLSADGVGVVWSLASGERVHTDAEAASFALGELSRDGSAFGSASLLTQFDRGKACRITRRPTLPGASAPRSWSLREQVTALAIDATDAVAGLWNGHLTALIDAEDDPIWTVSAHPTEITCIDLDPSAPRIASAAADGSLRLTDRVTGALIWQTTAHLGAVACLTISDDGTRIATGGHDGLVRLWNTADGALLGTLLATSECSAIIAPDGTFRAWGDVSHDIWFSAGQVRYSVEDIERVSGRSLRIPDDGTPFPWGRGPEPAWLA